MRGARPVAGLGAAGRARRAADRRGDDRGRAAAAGGGRAGRADPGDLLRRGAAPGLRVADRREGHASSAGAAGWRCSRCSRPRRCCCSRCCWSPRPWPGSSATAAASVLLGDRAGLPHRLGGALVHPDLGLPGRLAGAARAGWPASGAARSPARSWPGSCRASCCSCPSRCSSGCRSAGSPAIGATVAVGLWLYLLHVLVLIGYAMTFEIEQRNGVPWAVVDNLSLLANTLSHDDFLPGPADRPAGVRADR